MMMVTILIGLTSLYGGRGGYELFNARTVEFGNFAFDLIADYYYQGYIDTADSDTFHDRRHFGSGWLTLTFAPFPYFELFGHLTGFLHYDEKVEPIEIPIRARKDAYVYGSRSFGGGVKLGYPIVDGFPFSLIIGGRAAITASFNPPQNYDTLINRGFPPPENHSPDYDLRFLTTLEFGALGLNLNLGQIIRGRDRNTLLDRPDLGIYGLGLDLNVRNRTWLFGEIYTLGDSSHFTGGLKLGLFPNSTFDIFFKRSLSDSQWRVAAGLSIFSTITPQVKKGAVISGRVVDMETQTPLLAVISFPGSDVRSTMTRPDGSYRVELPPGGYLILVQASGYRPKERPIQVSAGSELIFDVALTPSRGYQEPIGRIRGRIFSEREEPIDGEVEVLGADVPEVRAEGGEFLIEVEPGRYEVAVHAPGYRPAGKIIYVKEEGEEVQADFYLREEAPIPGGLGKISGFIRDKETEQPISARVRAGGREVMTDEMGYYELEVGAGKPLVQVEADGYRPGKRVVEVEEGSDILLDFFLVRKRPKGVIIGSIYEAETMEPAVAEVIIEGRKVNIVTTDPRTGIFRIETEPGEYYVSVRSDGLETPKAKVELEAGEIEVLTFYLARREKREVSIPSFRPIYFDYGSTQYRYEDIDYLNRVAAYLLKHRDQRIEIRGHTDSVGPELQNLILSQRRAEVVRDYLISQGVEPARIYARGYGESLPVGDNRTLSGRELNRRVEFRILP